MIVLFASSNFEHLQYANESSPTKGQTAH